MLKDKIVCTQLRMPEKSHRGIAKSVRRRKKTDKTFSQNKFFNEAIEEKLSRDK